MERKKSKSHTVFQSYRNHLGEKQSIKQEVTNITSNAYFLGRKKKHIKPENRL